MWLIVNFKYFVTTHLLLTMGMKPTSAYENSHMPRNDVLVNERVYDSGPHKIMT